MTEKILAIDDLIYKFNLLGSKIQKRNLSYLFHGIIDGSKFSLLRTSRLKGDKDHTKLRNFLTKGWWDENQLNEKVIIEFINDSSYYFAISDDTNNVKTGNKIEGVGIFKCHEKTGFEKAHCKVTTGLINEKGVFLPIYTEIYLKQDEAKKQGKDFLTKNQIAQEHFKKLSLLVKNLGGHLYDSAYLNKESILLLNQLNMNLVSILGGKFNIYLDGKKIKVPDFKRSIDKRKMKTMKANKRKIRYLEYKIKLYNEIDMKIIAFIDYNTKNIKLLISNNLQWSAKRIYYEYSKRHSIEVYFKDCKQELQWGKCHLKKLDGHKKWDVIIMTLYTFLRYFLSKPFFKKMKISTTGKIVDYFREKIKFKSLYAKCPT
jgi:hypothetical protein